MASQYPNSSQSQNAWAPSIWDMYGNAAKVIEGLKNKADVRANFSPQELGSDAGRFVLDQYYAAKGETGIGTVIQAAFSSYNLTLLIAKMLPLIGVGAALGVDYAIYGAAAEGMGSAHMPFDLNAFGIGSLIFAGALGLSQKEKNWPLTIVLFLATVVATCGASFIAADKNELRSRFTKSLSSAFTAGSDDEYAKVKSLESEISSITNEIREYNLKLEKGGKDGQNMNFDGPENDNEMEEIIRRKHALEDKRQERSSELAKVKPMLELAKRKDPLDLWGRFLAALYTGAWLLAAQLMIAEVVRMASGNFKEARDKIAERKRQRKFFLDLENTDQEIRKSTIRAAVDATLSRFSEILSVSKSANKQDNLTTLFDESSYSKMAKVATEMVFAGIIPRESTITKILKYYRGDSAKK